jgi:hypothetical protein
MQRCGKPEKDLAMGKPVLLSTFVTLLQITLTLCPEVVRAQQEQLRSAVRIWSGDRCGHGHQMDICGRT